MDIPPPPPNLGCHHWFNMSIKASGTASLCCADAYCKHPIGDVRNSHLLEIFNGEEFRSFRMETLSRRERGPCDRCGYL